MHRRLLLLLALLPLPSCADRPAQYSEFSGEFRPVNHDTRYSAQQVKDAQARKPELIGAKAHSGGAGSGSEDHAGS